MLTMEVDCDPLELRDPLDCTTNDLFGGAANNSPTWASELEPELITCSDLGNGAGDEFRRVGPQKLAYCGSDTEPKPKKTRPKKKLNWRKVKRVRHQKNDRVKKIPRNLRCDVCDKSFITKSQLEDHTLSHWECKECGKECSNVRNSQEHSNSGHEDDSHLQVEESVGKEDERSGDEKRRTGGGSQIGCKKYYERLKSERKYHCEICQKMFITVGHLNTHRHLHSDKKWKCDGCGKNFSCERSLTRHKATFPGEHWFPCQFCGMNFFRVSNILKHLEIKHPEASFEAKRTGELILTHVKNEASEIVAEDRLICICTKCLKVFKARDHLKTHKETMHLSTNQDEGKEDVLSENCSEQTPRYKCDVCFKEFVSSEGFEYHRNNQHGVKQSEKRTKTQKTKNNREIQDGDNLEEENEVEAPTRRRSNTQSEQNFFCKICLQGFSSDSLLQTHLKSHDVAKVSDVKSGPHQCCICPRSFASSDGLKYHLATHTGEKRYSCSQCEKKFIKKTHLFEHVATHSKIKYFKCVLCPRTFSTHSAYRKHVKHFPGPHSFPCSKCGKLFTKESMLEKHVCVDLVNVTMAPEVKALLSTNCNLEITTADRAESRVNAEIAQTQGNAEEEPARTENSTGKSVNETDRSDESVSHSCYKCFKVFPNLSELQVHQNEHIGKQQYQCRFCPENFKRADEFSSHIRSHLGSSPYMCLKCNRKFISPLTLSMHAKKYPGDHSFICTKCQRWFPSERRLDKHECILQNSDKFVCACGAHLKNWKEFVQHAGVKPYACCSCNLTYLTLVALARHIKKHTGEKPFACEECGKSFRSKNNYLHHKSVHEEVKEIHCEHCQFKSKSQKRMNFHLFRKHNVGSNSSSTLCPVCGLIFPYITQVEKHIETEHSKEMASEQGSKDQRKASSTVLCNLCGKLLSNKYMLVNHMKKVHDPEASKNIQEYKCYVCSQKFRSKKVLEKHVQVHEAPGLRNCEICNKEFYFAKDLRKHMRKHDTNKPFSCEKCGKTFKVSVSLKYHSTICGNGHDGSQVETGNGEKKEINRAEGNIYLGHVDPLDPGNGTHTVVYGCWN